MTDQIIVCAASRVMFVSLQEPLHVIKKRACETDGTLLVSLRRPPQLGLCVYLRPTCHFLSPVTNELTA